MKRRFAGWTAVAERLEASAIRHGEFAEKHGEERARLNAGQRASLHAIAARITNNGLLIADEVGMGKTRIAVEVARTVVEAGGRVAILVPPGLGYQWADELRDGRLDAPPILRSLFAYLEAWQSDDLKSQRPWFESDVVVVSHVFTNWRLGDRAEAWRWALLPEVYSRWRAQVSGRVPRGYHGNEQLSDKCVRNAGASIVRAKLDRKLLQRLISKVRWADTLKGENYSRSNSLRGWLERVVGVGLGIFNLVILDEAHKSRGAESGLSRLLESVIATAPDVRRFALTATPVELDASQWQHTLSRIGLQKDELTGVQETITEYARAVKRVRESWRTSQEARDAYVSAAQRFQSCLAPYVLRRDKREDPSVQKFQQYSGEALHAYRSEREISVETASLPPAWRQAVCAAESLSVVTDLKNDPVAKRLRLTLGNGHGISALMDQMKSDADLDQKQLEHDENTREGARVDESAQEIDPNGVGVSKREERASWWRACAERAFSGGDATLLEHPAILAAVKVIEELTSRDEKVLVFGRFTRPLRALVDLLNAREMLRRVHVGQLWPQAKVHGLGDDNEWPAVRAAHRQLQSTLSVDTLDDVLAARYAAETNRRERARGRLIARVEEGLAADPKLGSGLVGTMFEAFKRRAQKPAVSGPSDQSAVAIVSRAITELLGNPDEEPPAEIYAEAFGQLIAAVSDRDDGDIAEHLNDEANAERWQELEARLREEFDRPQGGFARLMYGKTPPATRRMLQLAFNRPKSFPRVLVAQSLVGREGLNLHKACRVVVLLHPEWNPGVVEQQIGRVDRVGSHWCAALKQAMDDGVEAPRIEVRPVIFRGTYDEHHWDVLRERWDDFRAQLHGVAIPPRFARTDEEGRDLIAKLERSRPDFSPLPHEAGANSKRPRPLEKLSG